MHGSILAVLALVALVQGVSCGPLASTHRHIDALAQKLEDHYCGKNLNNEITFAECRSTFKEFAGLGPDDLKLPHGPDSLYRAVLFLNDFMYLHLKNIPGKLMELQTDKEAASKFVRTLEETYTRFRAVYNFEFSIYDLDVQDRLLVPINHLAGKGQLPTREEVAEARKVITEVKEAMSSNGTMANVYKNLDDVEMVLEISMSPEIAVWRDRIWPLFSDDDRQTKYFGGDEATIELVQRVYQEGVAETIQNLRIVRDRSHQRPVTNSIDALAQKLEDHYHGEKLDNEITFAECRSTFKEFAGLSPDDLKLPHGPDPLYKALLFLNDFMYLNLKNVPTKLIKLETEHEAAKEFVRTLETTYKRFRPVYNFESSIYDLDLQESLLLPMKHLAGLEDRLPTRSEVAEARKTMTEVARALSEMTSKGDIYKNLDDFESLLQVWMSPDAAAWVDKIWPLFFDEVLKANYFEGDPGAVKEMQVIYQNGMAEIIKNLRNE